MHALEDELIARNITCAYSLSRALSIGMNAVFFQMGYRYYGRLTKNCDIYDKFEDMNLWAKMLKVKVKNGTPLEAIAICVSFSVKKKCPFPPDTWLRSGGKFECLPAS